MKHHLAPVPPASFARALSEGYGLITHPNATRSGYVTSLVRFCANERRWRYATNPTDPGREGPLVAVEDHARIRHVPTDEEIARDRADEDAAHEEHLRKIAAIERRERNARNAARRVRRA